MKIRKPFKWAIIPVLLLQLTVATAQQKNTSVLVVRGGHPYDTPQFEEMCESLEGVDVDLVLTAHMQAMKPEDIANKYDAILFLNQNKHYKEYAKNKQRLMQLTDLGVGMVFLHFTLSSYPHWDEFHDLVGGKWHLGKYTQDKSKVSTYKVGLTLDVKVLDKKHPVAKGLKDFELTDTYYGKITTSDDLHPILGVDHEGIHESIVWTHNYNKSKVVYIMPGYSKSAYENKSYRKLVANALKYVGE